MWVSSARIYSAIFIQRSAPLGQPPQLWRGSNSPEKFKLLGAVNVILLYVASRKLNLGDGESILSLLYEAYGDANRIDDDQIKADFGELYGLLNGMPAQEMDWIINPVCALCRDHERSGFVYGVQVGIWLAQETRIAE